MKIPPMRGFHLTILGELDMDLPTLRDLFESHKEDIFQAVTHHIGRFPWTPYQHFLIHTEEGQRRLRIFVSCSFISFR